MSTHLLLSKTETGYIISVENKPVTKIYREHVEKTGGFIVTLSNKPELIALGFRQTVEGQTLPVIPVIKDLWFKMDLPLLKLFNVKEPEVKDISIFIDALLTAEEKHTKTLDVDKYYGIIYRLRDEFSASQVWYYLNEYKIDNASLKAYKYELNKAVVAVIENHKYSKIINDVKFNNILRSYSSEPAFTHMVRTKLINKGYMFEKTVVLNEVEEAEAIYYRIAKYCSRHNIDMIEYLLNDETISSTELEKIVEYVEYYNYKGQIYFDLCTNINYYEFITRLQQLYTNSNHIVIFAPEIITNILFRNTKVKAALARMRVLKDIAYKNNIIKNSNIKITCKELQ